MQCILTNAIPTTEHNTTIQTLLATLSQQQPSVYRNETLIDISRMCWSLKLRQFALQAYDMAIEGNIVSKILKVSWFYCF